MLTLIFNSIIYVRPNYINVLSQFSLDCQSQLDVLILKFFGEAKNHLKKKYLRQKLKQIVTVLFMGQQTLSNTTNRRS